VLANTDLVPMVTHHRYARVIEVTK
jgi:hypothetical protein